MDPNPLAVDCRSHAPRLAGDAGEEPNERFCQLHRRRAVRFSPGIRHSGTSIAWNDDVPAPDERQSRLAGSTPTAPRTTLGTGSPPRSRPPDRPAPTSQLSGHGRPDRVRDASCRCRPRPPPPRARHDRPRSRRDTAPAPPTRCRARRSTDRRPGSPCCCSGSSPARANSIHR